MSTPLARDIPPPAGRTVGLLIFAVGAFGMFFWMIISGMTLFFGGGYDLADGQAHLAPARAAWWVATNGVPMGVMAVGYCMRERPGRPTLQAAAWLVVLVLVLIIAGFAVLPGMQLGFGVPGAI